MVKKIRKLPFWQQIIIILIATTLAFSLKIYNDNYADNEYYEVTKVVDGDTFKIIYNNKSESVRLIGIDTPESVHPDVSKNNELGKCASDYTKQLLEGKVITLEFDIQERDKYGRLLAYVYLDGEMINKKLISEGYAQISTYPPNTKYVDDFTKLQQEARDSNRGLWNENNCIPSTVPTTKSSNIKPLKALCNDGEYEYAKDASKDTYQGMCSGHGGIKEKLGRSI